MALKSILLPLALGVFCVSPAFGGVGAGMSGIETIDTAPPTLTVDLSPIQSLFQGGQSVQFTILTDDDNPGDAGTAHRADIMDADTFMEGINFTPTPTGFVYDWQVPEISSAQIHLVATSRDSFGNLGTAVSPTMVVIPSVTDVPQAEHSLRFGPAHPNPFNPEVHFVITLPEAGQVELGVYDTRGRRVHTLLHDNRPAGRLDVTWNGTDAGGFRQPGGVYLFELVFRNGKDTFRIHQKAVLLP